MEPVCYTLEGALEKAIDEEKHSVKVYSEAMKKVEDPHARAILKDLAKDELEHRNTIEKALLGETLAHLDPEEPAGPVTSRMKGVEDSQENLRSCMRRKETGRNILGVEFGLELRRSQMGLFSLASGEPEPARLHHVDCGMRNLVFLQASRCLQYLFQLIGPDRG